MTRRANNAETSHVAAWLHFTEQEYDQLLAAAPLCGQTRTDKRRGRRDFVTRWPDLVAWSQAPLMDRLLHSPAGASAYLESVVAGQRFYVCALAMAGRVRLDYPWLLLHRFTNLLHSTGFMLGFGPGWLDVPIKEAERIGYEKQTARRSLHHACLRIALSKADPRWEHTTIADLHHQRDEIIAMARRPDIVELRAASSASSNVASWYRSMRTHPHVAHVVLHSLGIIAEPAQITSIATQAHALPAAPAPMNRSSHATSRGSRRTEVAIETISVVGCGPSPPGSDRATPRSLASPSSPATTSRSSSPG